MSMRLLREREREYTEPQARLRRVGHVYSPRGTSGAAYHYHAGILVGRSGLRLLPLTCRVRRYGLATIASPSAATAVGPSLFALRLSTARRHLVRARVRG